MFGKNPFILPLFAGAFLIFLFLFQQQQKKKSETLRAEAAAGKKDTSVAILTLKDPIFGTSQGAVGKCSDGKAYGLEYPVTQKIEKGHIEFDLFNFAKSEVENIPLFALHPGRIAPCPPTLLDSSLMGLFLNIKTDSLKLFIRTKNGLFAGATKLTDSESPPFRFLVEWVSDTLTLYINGVRTTDIKYEGTPEQGENRLFLGQSQDKKAAELRSLKLYLVP